MSLQHFNCMFLDERRLSALLAMSARLVALRATAICHSLNGPIPPTAVVFLKLHLSAISEV